jgi:hypothetical protein
VTQGALANWDLSQLVEPALAGLDVTVLAALGHESGALPVPVPPNAHVAEFISFDVLLPKASVYVTNGGFGGTQQAIAADVRAAGHPALQRVLSLLIRGGQVVATPTAQSRTPMSDSGSETGAARCGKVWSDAVTAALTIALTCANAAYRLMRAAVRSVRDEAAAGSSRTGHFH